MQAGSDSIPTRQSLLLRLRSVENSESWQEFFETYWSLIYTMAIRAGLKDSEAQDVVQETVICVAKSMPTFEYNPSGSFKAWLRKLTRWRIIDHLRKSRYPFIASEIDVDRLSVSAIPDESDVSFESTWEDEWKKAVIEAAARRTKAKVKEKHYQIFDFFALRGWPAEKVAATLRTTIPQVWLANHRVRKVFDAELKRLDSEAKI